MFTHTLYLSLSTQSRYLSTYKRPLYLCTVYAHSPNLSLSRSLYTHFCYYCTVHILSIYLRTLPLSVHTTSLSLSIDLSSHTPSLYHCAHSFSLPLDTLALSICTHTQTLPLCLSTTFRVLQFSISCWSISFFVYSVNNINFSGGLDALGINSVCPALCY